MPPGNTPALDFRRMLRRDSTDAEKRLWTLLRNCQLGAKFRRQHPVGPYVLDFFCVDRLLAIELDGGQHFAEAEIRRDRTRSEYLESHGIRVLRFTNFELLGETDAVVDAVWNALHEGSSPSP